MKRTLIYLLFAPLLFGFAYHGNEKKVPGKAQFKEQSKEKIPQDAILFVFDNHLYLPSTINNSLKGYFIFDTGADRLYMDDTYFKQSGLNPQKTLKGRMGGVGANAQSVTIVQESTSFQSSEYQHNFDSYIVFGLRNIIGCHADGMVGLQSFLKTPLEVNYEQSYLRTYPNELPSTKGYLKLPLKTENNRLYTELTIGVIKGKTIKEWFLIDLGNGGYVSITSPTANQFQLADIPKKQVKLEMMNGGVGGESSSVYLRSDYIAIGNDTLKNVPIEYSLDTKGALSSTKHCGLIGNKLLKQYNLIFDFKGNVLYVKPFSSNKSDFSLNKWQFIYSNRTDITPYWIVNGVYRGSNADKEGLSKGDSISHINGKAVNTITWEEERKREIPDRLDLTIKTQKGETKHIHIDTRENVLP